MIATNGLSLSLPPPSLGAFAANLKAKTSLYSSCLPSAEENIRTPNANDSFLPTRDRQESPVPLPFFHLFQKENNYISLPPAWNLLPWPEGCPHESLHAWKQANPPRHRQTLMCMCRDNAKLGDSGLKCFWKSSMHTPCEWMSQWNMHIFVIWVTRSHPYWKKE